MPAHAPCRAGPAVCGASGQIRGDSTNVVGFLCNSNAAQGWKRVTVAITGEVLRMESRKGGLGLDEGNTDLTTAWALPTVSPDIAPGPRCG